jgi:cytolysin (calcineurin-like family phosphatase)
MESVRDMCNEAFDRYNIPMTAQWSGNDDHPIKFISDNQTGQERVASADPDCSKK